MISIDFLYMPPVWRYDIYIYIGVVFRHSQHLCMHLRLSRSAICTASSNLPWNPRLSLSVLCLVSHVRGFPLVLPGGCGEDYRGGGRLRRVDGADVQKRFDCWSRPGHAAAGDANTLLLMELLLLMALVVLA